MSKHQFDALQDRALGIGDLSPEEWEGLLEEKARRFAAWCDEQKAAQRKAEEEHRGFARVKQIRSGAFWWIKD